MIRQRDVEEKGPWRGSRHGNPPSSASVVSRTEDWRAEGVSTFSVSVLVRGHGIHNQYKKICVLLARNFESTKTRRESLLLDALRRLPCAPDTLTHPIRAVQEIRGRLLLVRGYGCLQSDMQTLGWALWFVSLCAPQNLTDFDQ